MIFQLGVIALVVAVVGFILFRGSSDSADGPEATLRTASPRQTLPSSVEFVRPLDGDVVTNPLQVHVAVGEALIKPASAPAAAGEGHFRILLDAPGSLPLEAPVPAEYTLVDLEDGSNMVTLDPLPPGQHSLTVVFEDSSHVPLPGIPPQRITITVEG